VSDRAFDNLAYAAEHTTVVADLMGDQRFATTSAGCPTAPCSSCGRTATCSRRTACAPGCRGSRCLRIDGMIKLLLEQHRIPYLPIESVSMQERVRAVEFVLSSSRLACSAV
jgi:endogenous inhibitor of DNA gyrase (YacG/DUF329 family)